MKLTTMKTYVKILSLALLAMTGGVTADGPVRAYHPSFSFATCMFPNFSFDGTDKVIESRSIGHVELLCQRLNNDAPGHGHSELGCQRRVHRADSIFQVPPLFGFFQNGTTCTNYSVPTTAKTCLLFTLPRSISILHRTTNFLWSNAHSFIVHRRMDRVVSLTMEMEAYAELSFLAA
jgi:hypothetical protein